ncbi:TetR family transcriptional regulator [Diaphorobacter aerolatus]|uniref:TetR family transcriptional regulator n=1 Tax=Diaphorobacter aerolatus TaxID=1288495 RepID=A0A7H0GPW6_9BURK|nr:TetR family transcriptional regulator [Diaphorobacter aerolatus]QNP50332.1 TetR family transcriptional regulator [Diaphorobacter aerolatus]
MARRTKAEADETRTRLLDAAEEVFFEKGVSRTSLGDIAQRAGATRGAVYWHFKDKVDLFSSMLNRVCMPFDELCDDLYGDMPPLVRIRESIRNVFENVTLDERRRKIFDTAMFKMEYVGELEDMRERHIDAARVSRAKFTQDLAAAAEQLNVTLPCPLPSRRKACMRYSSGSYTAGS